MAYANFPGFVSPTFDPQAIDENLLDAIRRKAEADATKAFVLENFKSLKGTMYPLEIMNIQVLPHLECLILEDHFLLSFKEAETLIRGLNK